MKCKEILEKNKDVLQSEKSKGDDKPIILGDSIKIRGFVEIRNGDKVIHAENKFTQSMLAWLNNMCSIYSVSSSNLGSYYWFVSSSAWDIYIGTDQGTSTLYNTIALVSPIGTSPGTPANSKNASMGSPSGGIFNIVYSATWNAGTVSGTVGEMALYMRVKDTLQPFGWSLVLNTGLNITETEKLISRLSAADGNFSSFFINEANPLVITWTVSFSFS